MKKRKVLLLFLLMVVGYMVSDQIVSAAKELEKKEYSLYVQQGKTYKLSEVLTNLWDVEADKTLQKSLRGKNVTWSAKKTQLKLTKNAVKVKKQGEYKLTGKTEKYKYIITLKAMPGKWPVIPEGITSASIMKNGIIAEVKDANTVQYLCSLFNSADYRFKQIYTKPLVGFTYIIKLYYANGMEERSFAIGHSLAGGYCSKKWKEVEKYIDELYVSLLSEQ